MFGITDIVAYVAGVFAIILLPGPNSLYCLTVSATSKKAGVGAMLGILLGDTVLILATVLGAGTVLKLYPMVFHVIKLVGGGYLAYLGVRLLMSARITLIQRQSVDFETVVQPSATPKGAFYKALSLSLTNPKAILFFLSFFLPFVDPTYPNPALSFTILGVILQVVSAMYLSSLILFGGLLVETFKGKRLINSGALAVVGGLFLWFAINLWRASL